jgi:D-hydroxyproline dehydrogenase subunit beta
VRVIVVGAGIFGLAHAWAAAKRGHSVTVIERSPRASGASIRNFGMVWPIGQMPGESLEIALESRALWLEATSAAGIWANPCGSMHVAFRQDEWTVLQEFAAQSAQLGYDCKLLNPAEIAQKSPAIRTDGLLGALFSSTEVCVNPPRTIRALPRWLSEQHQIDFQFGVQVNAVDSSGVHLAGGHKVAADKVIVCSGSDFETLFPDVLQAAGMRRCKLQMFKVASPGSDWRIGTHLASGLTLRHYKNFQVCPSLNELKTRIATETPELDRFGIHVMASQNETGEIILGDSHLYDDEIEPFDSDEIDSLILRELKRWLNLPNWNIVQRWHGIYAKLDSGYVFEHQPVRDVHVCTGLGGSGMTMSFGIAERFWRSL